MYNNYNMITVGYGLQYLHAYRPMWCRAFQHTLIKGRKRIKQFKAQSKLKKVVLISVLRIALIFQLRSRNPHYADITQDYAAPNPITQILRSPKSYYAEIHRITQDLSPLRGRSSA